MLPTPWEGFGILCMASIGPIMTVLITGLWKQYQARVRALAKTKVSLATAEPEAKGIL